MSDISSSNENNLLKTNEQLMEYRKNHTSVKQKQNLKISDSF